MIQNPSRLAHTIRRNYNHRAFLFVQSLGLFDACGVRKRAESERIFMMFQKRLVHRFIVTFGMHTEYARGIRSHRRIHINRNHRNFPLIRKQMQIENQFLHTLNRKRRNYDFSFFGASVPDNFFQFLHCKRFCLVKFVSVRAFHNDVVGSRKIRGRRTDYRFFLAPDIARKKNAFFFRTVGYCKIRKRRPQNMPRIKKLHFYIRGDIHFPVIRHGNNLIHTANNVFFRENRSPVESFAFFLGLLSQKFSVSRLNPRAVHHHDIRDVPCSWCRIYVSPKTSFSQNRQKSAMVVMPVRKNHRFKFVSRIIKISVFCVGCLAASLKSTAIYHYLLAVHLDYMF